MKKTLLIIFGIIFWVELSAQSISPDAISATGDYSTGTNATLSWTLGEPVIETTTGSNAILTQGFQQNSYTFVSVYEKPERNFDISVYPNPTTEFVNVKTNAVEQDLLIQLYDIQGKLLKEIIMKDNTKQINLSKYSSSNYLLKISNKNGELIRSWKIIKN